MKSGNNHEAMELLKQMEKAIGSLITRLDSFKVENARLLEEISALTREKTLLENENKALHKSLAEQEALRLKAVGRIDGLLRKLQNYEKVDQVVL